MSKETTLTTAILKALRKQGGKWEKKHGSIYTTKGFPDIIGSWNGQTYALEVKLPGKKDEPGFYENEPTPKQHLELMAWRDEGGAIVGVVRSKKDALSVVTPRTKEGSDG